MSQKIKYVHTNLIAKDWRKLAEFYIKVFGCKPTYPERDLSGKWIDEMTQINNVKIKGIHLQLPGYKTSGSTLEIFEFNKKEAGYKPSEINNYGFGHIAFRAENVEELAAKVIEYGGQKYGEIVYKEIAGVGYLTAVYMRDPEGNIIELQNWKKIKIE